MCQGRAQVETEWRGRAVGRSLWSHVVVERWDGGEALKFPGKELMVSSGAGVVVQGRCWWQGRPMEDGADGK